MQAKHGLTLKWDLKTKSGIRELIWSNPVLGEKERRKGRESYGLGEDQVLGGISSHFLLLRDQTTYKRRFEEIQGMNTNPNFTLL